MNYPMIPMRPAELEALMHPGQEVFLAVYSAMATRRTGDPEIDRLLALNRKLGTALAHAREALAHPPHRPDYQAILQALVNSIEDDMGTYFDDHAHCDDQACTLCIAKAALAHGQALDQPPGQTTRQCPS